MKKNIKVYAILGAMTLALIISVLPVKNTKAKENEFWGTATKIRCSEIVAAKELRGNAAYGPLIAMMEGSINALALGDEITCNGFKLQHCGGTDCVFKRIVKIEE